MSSHPRSTSSRKQNDTLLKEQRKSQRLIEKKFKTICPVCSLIVKDGQSSVCCDKCNTWYHEECIREKVEDLQNVKWFCVNCKEELSANASIFCDTIVNVQNNKDKGHASRVSSAAGVSHINSQQASLSALLERNRLADEIDQIEIEKLEAIAKHNNEQARIEQQILNVKAKKVQREFEISGRSSNASSKSSNFSENVLKRTIDWVKFRDNTANINFNKHVEPNNCDHGQVNDHDENYDKPSSARETKAIPNYESTGAYQRHNRNVVPQQMIVHQSYAQNELPKFDGNPTDWPLFIASYNMSTQRGGYSDVDNLIRLKKALHGKALDAVRGRLFIPSQVTSVIQRLGELFGRPVQILATIEEKVSNLPIIQENNMDGIIQLALEVDYLCGTIEATAKHEYLSNPQLLHQLTAKLPGYLRFEWAKYSEDVELVNLSTFRDWMNGTSSRASRVVANEPSTQSRQSQHQRSQHSPMKQKSKNKFMVATHDCDNSKSHNSEPKQEQLCKICEKGSHSVPQCQMYKQMSPADRWKVVFKKGICGKCLGYHNYRKCNNAKPCNSEGCVKIHHPTLHGSRTITNTSANIHVSSSLQHKHHASQGVYFRILPVTLHNGNHSVSTYGFLDEGSSVTLLDTKLAQQLKLTGPSRSLCLTWTKEIQRTEEDSQLVKLKISGVGTQKFPLNDVYTVSDLKLPTQQMSVKVSERENTHLRGIPFANDEYCQPMILIGQNHYQLGVPLEIKSGKWSEPIAARTRLGWTLYGKSNTHHYNFTINLHECGCNNSKELNELVKGFSSLDTFGVGNNNVPESEDNKRAMSIFQKAHYDGERYTAGLLWKKDETNLPESRSMAVRRLECFERKLLKDEALRQEIIVKFNEYIVKGYARKLTPNEIKPKRNTWYLPMFCVTNPNKPGKPRLIWDAASKSNGLCLNDVLLKGPDQLTLLPHVLYKFREQPIGLSADVTEMFHQVRINRVDQEAQRFLWRDCDTSIQPQEYIMQVQTFGATCSPSVSQYIKNINSDRFQAQYPKASRAIKENFYVDDYLDSFPTINEAIEVSDQVRMISASGGFVLKDWRSNSDIVTGTSQQKEMKAFEEKGSQASKVLGMHWHVSSDTFTFRINYDKIPQEVRHEIRPPTKREVLRVLMCVFDPLGLLSSYLILGKILLREIWNSNINWDESIKESEHKRWIEWCKLMESIEKVQIPRCYALNTNIELRQVHMFADASESAFAAVCYIRSESVHGVEVRQIGSKTRIAPNKPLSIPRLELMSAVMGSRLLKSIEEGHRIKFDERFLWTDSKTVLSWINSKARDYKQFVGLRIGEIIELTERHEWRWVSTKNNVADEATKRLPNTKFSTHSRWNDGPEFLYEPQSTWEYRRDFAADLPPEEFRVQIHVTGESEQLIPKTPDVARFSTWNKLLRTQATVIRFVKNLKATVLHQERNTLPLQRDELELAKSVLMRKMQWECFNSEVIQFNNDHRSIVEKSSELFRYTPFMDEEGVIRMSGRITKIEGIPYDTKFPIIMDKNHPITTLIINDMHRQFLHQNHEVVISELRSKYVIPQLRRQLQRIRTACQRCKNRSAMPIAPLMGQLPRSRLSPGLRPFSYTGIDCFGPIEVVNGRKVEKRWGVLCTCMTIRAIHIEVVNSLSADSFIMALTRFIQRRGKPAEITCDNGTNFRGGSQELARELKNIDPVRIQNEFSYIKWKFNPPGAPHFGGAWERMIQSVKSNLFEVISKRRKPTDELLNTVLVQCEGIVNSRPLTHIPLNDVEDQPLTPNHFLLGSSDGTKSFADLSGVDDNKIFRKMWITSEQISKQFWRKWVRDYLPTLTKRTKWFAPTRALSVGDVVVIADENHPVRYWPKGIIEEVYAGDDGQIRSARVKTAEGNYKRPATKIAILEVNKPPQSIIEVENVDDSELSPKQK